MTLKASLATIESPIDLFDIHGTHRSTWRFRDLPTMKGSIVLITGANSGLGLEFSRHMARTGAHVILACRNRQKGMAAMEKILAETPDASLELRLVELTDRRSIEAFAHGILHDFDHLDVLCNNAGIGTIPSQSVEGWDHIFFVNSVAPFLLTTLLLPLIKRTKAARIVFVGSIMYAGAKDLRRDELHAVDKASISSRNTLYSYSKLANIFMAKEMAKRLQAAGLDTIVTAAHPGGAATPLHSRPGNPMKPIAPIINVVFQSAEMGAAPLLYAATNDKVISGDYIGPGGIGALKGWPVKETLLGIGLNQELQAKLWSLLEEVSRVEFPL